MNKTCPATGYDPNLEAQLACILVKGHQPADQHVDQNWGYWYGDDVDDYSLVGD